MHSTRLLGARTHNLRGVDFILHPGQVTVLTGPSGAGKSSLALDTLYAEGQRRFVESFSPYARQFLERLARPPVDSLDPVPAAVAVDRAVIVKSSRSTVATMADLEAYFAALFLRESLPHCPAHGLAARALDTEAASSHAIEQLAGEQGTLVFERPVRDAEQYLELREHLLSEGYRRLWIDGQALDINTLKPSQIVERGHASVVLDRLRAGEDDRPRWRSGIETAWHLAQGVARVFTARDSQRPQLFLRRGLSCPECHQPLKPPSAGQFSTESPLAACPSCRGFGRVIGLDPDKVIPDPDRPLDEGAIRPWVGKATTQERAELAKLCRRHGIDLHRTWRSLSESDRELIWRGDGDWSKKRFPGIWGWFKWLETKTYKMHVRVFLSRFRSYDPCPDCRGSRFNPTTLSYKVGGLTIAEWHALEVDLALTKLRALQTRSAQGELARRELASRLEYLSQVGVGYLTLQRQARTLSGGEAQRVTLTAALGTSLHNALFVLDEPTVGLHASDVPRLEQAVRRLAERNNAVLIVENDPYMLMASDRVVELGPGSGKQGGTIVRDGPPAPSGQRPKRSSGGTLSRSTTPASTALTTPRADQCLRLQSVSAHNLKNIDVDLPLGCVCVVTGPSGSGKSTLVSDVLHRALARRLGDLSVPRPEPHGQLLGAEGIKQVLLVDQAPLGRTSRGNPATYTKAWDAIRRGFSQEPRALARGYGPSHFSFNVSGGRCEACAGEGYETIEMQFLADVHLVCSVCQGRRFSKEALAVRHREQSVADVLESSVAQVLERFADLAAVVRALGPVAALGLGYLSLGQPLSTLSGGEAQRLKLARALTSVRPGSLVIVDEPSAGLHPSEVGNVLQVLRNLVRAGASVIAVEHDLDFIRQADWVIDLGPEGGAGGGHVVGAGTPSTLAQLDTKTGLALRHPLEPPRRSGSAHEQVREISIRGAREHNLKDVHVTIPHGSLTVVTGPSGSGKSSLAFDVLFAEGQRRFMETLTPYARQFLPMMPRPDVESVTGLVPSIALEQRTTRAGALSTVATVTEVAHYLRLLYAKLGTTLCPEHGLAVQRVAPEQLLLQLQAQRGPFELLAPMVKARKGLHQDVFNAAQRAGISSAYCDGQRVDTDAPPRLTKTREHTIDLLIEKLSSGKHADRALLDRALDWGQGEIKLRPTRGEEVLLRLSGACPTCQRSVQDPDPRWFSFGTEQGRCPKCEGRGRIEAPAKRGKPRSDANEPPGELCPECEGTRLSKLGRSVQVGGMNYPQLTAQSVKLALHTVKTWCFERRQRPVWQPIVSELGRRLAFLVDVGLDYLALDRLAATLSGGEMQRLRLAAQLGAGLTGALYVLDEPTIGLHPSDTGRLLSNLRALVDLGSTVVVVEHDADVIRAADYLIDLGPGGGAQGGQLITCGSPRQVLAHPHSPTASAFSSPPRPRPALSVSKQHPMLSLTGVRQHNLAAVDARFPLQRLTVVAGVSGSGKSSLVRGVLLPAVRQALDLVTPAPGKFASLTGLGELSRALSVDQTPIGRTPRSVPATFLGIWDAIRSLFGSSPDAQVQGFKANRFSFNAAAGGRCATCQGQGVITHEMSFLPDVVQRCPACEGLRFEPGTLEVRYRDLNIGQVLQLTASDATQFFAHHPRIAAPLRVLTELGAGYVQLGQGSHTLSGGEAQRLKLAAELCAGQRHAPTLYVLDEPTTGLHLADVERLMSVLERLVGRGDTLIVIEHHPDVIAGADWVIELGPVGGEGGGKVLYSGPPDKLAGRATATGRVLQARTRHQ